MPQNAPNRPKMYCFRDTAIYKILLTKRTDYVIISVINYFGVLFMLKLILSRAGGKTAHISGVIENLLNEGGKKITLIVPEQFSFTTEKTMLARVGAKAMADIDVLSFTSLAEMLVGKPALHERRRLDDSAKAVLMSMALESVKDKLKLYGKLAGKRSAITEFTALSSEFKLNALSTDDVRLALATQEESLLKMKLNDIVTIIDAYEAEIGNGYFNPDDLLSELYEVLPSSDYFDGRYVFIDAFRGFTAEEYKILSIVMQRAADVYVTLCTDSLENSDDETDLFAHTKRTAKELITVARKNSCPVAQPVYPQESGKYKKYNSPELASLESNLFAPVAENFEGECENITLCKAADIYAECRFVACTAKKLIRENGYRCRDIAVIARDASAYEAPLGAELKKCGIGMFEDSRQPVDVSPVVAFVSSAASIISKGFDTETVMRYLKTGLAGFETEEISEIENYCYLWRINYGAWLKEWTQNPEGFGSELDDEGTKTLECLNAYRERIVRPLESLRFALTDVSGEDAAKAVYAFLEKVNAAENLKKLACGLIEAGEVAIANELDRLWNVVIDLLDGFETVSKGRVVTPKSFCEMFELMLSVQTVGSLPQGLDEITVGSADRIRTLAPKVVFVAGANYGSFPAIPTFGAALTDKDRRRMHEIGLELAGYGENKLAEEKLIAYNAFCCASDKLFVCAPERNAKGEQLAPSELYLKIKSLFPACKEVDASELDDMYYVEGREIAFEKMAENMISGNAFYASLKSYFESDPEYSGRIAALERAADGRNFEIEDKSVAKTLFGRDLHISASRVESFYKCPFSYFCRYGIKAMPRKVAELDPMQRGNVIHHTLEKLLTDYSREKLCAMSSEELLAAITAIMDEYLASKLDGEQRNERFLYLYRKLAHNVCDVAQRLIEEFAFSNFSPVEFELQIGGDGAEIPPYRVQATEGEVSIYGAIDRVDTAEIEGKKYFRVVDYKSSGKEFRLSDVAQGLNMQMFIYLFALWQNGGEKFADSVPAGVLYYPANSPLVTAERGEDPADIKERKQKKCRMQGIVLENGAVIAAMDSSLSGLYIPVEMKKGELKGSMISLVNLERLKEKADGVLADMADALHGGKIEAFPAEGKSYKHVCEYCDYKSVCSYEENIPVRELFDDDLAQVLKNLEEGDEANGGCTVD